MKTDTKTRRLFSLAAAIMAAASLHAAPVIYEPFAQTPAGSISGKAGGTGLNTWAVVSTASTVATTPTLAYGQVVNSGGQLSLPNGGGQTAYVTTTAALANAGLLADGATLWFSFVYSKAAGGGTNERSGFAFGTDHLVTAVTSGASMSNSGNGLGVFTKDNGILPITWNGGGSGVTATGTSFAAYNDTVTIVGRIVWGANSGAVESLTIWSPNEVSLPLDVAALGTGFSKTMTGVDQTVFDTISMQQRNSGGAIIYDELRFGATYLDVIAATTASVYWDPNGTVAGAGATPNGDWDGATTPWNTDYTGGSAGTVSTWPAGGVAILSAGSDASGAYAVNLDGTRSLAGLIVKNGDPTISGGTALDVVASGASFDVRPGLSATIGTPITQSITGTGNLSKEGPGTLTLSVNNTYACPTAVNAGKLILSGDNSGSSSAVTVNGGVIQFNSTASIPSTGPTVTVNAGNGAAMFDTLSNANIAAGLLRIVAASAGTVAADNNSGAAAVFDFNTAGLTAASLGAVGSVNFTGTITPNATAKYRLGGGGGTLTLANTNALTGANAVTVVGPGTVVVSAANNVSADTTISVGGKLVVGNSAALNGRKVTFSGVGELILASNFSTGGNQIFYSTATGAKIRSDSTTARSVTGILKGNSGAVIALGDATNNGKLTFNSQPLGTSGGLKLQCDSDVEFAAGLNSGADIVTKSGAGTMIISANGPNSGAFSITAGVIRIKTNTALGTIAGGVTVAANTALEIDGTGGAVIVGNEALSINGGGISNAGALRNIAGDNTYGGTVTMAAQSRINSDSGTLLLNNASALTGPFTLVVGGAGNLTISGQMTNGVGGLSKNDGGTMTLSGSNNYTGPTAVNGGKLVVATGIGTRNASAVTVANTLGCIFGVKLAAANGQWDSSSSLTVDGSSSQIEVDYDGTAPSTSTSEDPIKVTDLNISGAGTLKVLGITPSTPNGTYPLINFTGTGPAAADPYTGLTLSLPGGVTGKLTTTANHVNLVIEDGTTYTVTYDDNVSTGGSVPVDAATYATAATVTVLGNTGSLVKTGFVFTGWNTQADGLGTHYNPAATFPMGSANVTLFAEWKTPYQAWATGDEAFDGDANGDGVQDGIAFLLGAATPGTDASELLPTVSESGGDLILTFDCLPIAARGGSSLKVAYSNTLASFTAATNVVPNATGADAGGVVSYVVTGPSGSPSVYNVVATIDSSAAGGGKLFGRLQGTE